MVLGTGTRAVCCVYACGCVRACLCVRTIAHSSQFERVVCGRFHRESQGGQHQVPLQTRDTFAYSDPDQKSVVHCLESVWA